MITGLAWRVVFLALEIISVLEIFYENFLIPADVSGPRGIFVTLYGSSLLLITRILDVLAYGTLKLARC